MRSYIQSTTSTYTMAIFELTVYCGCDFCDDQFLGHFFNFSIISSK